MYNAISRISGLQTPSLTGVGAIRGRFLNALSNLSTRLVGAMSYGSPSSRWQMVNLSAGLSGYLGAGKVVPTSDASRLAPAQTGPVKGNVAAYQSNWAAGGPRPYCHPLGGRTPALDRESEFSSFTGGRATPSDANLGYQTGSSVPAEGQGSTITILPTPPGQPGTPATPQAPAAPVSPGASQSPGLPPTAYPTPSLGAPATGIPGSYLDNGNPSNGIPSAYTNPLPSPGMPSLGAPATGIPGSYTGNGNPSSGIPSAYTNPLPAPGMPSLGAPATGIPGSYTGNGNPSNGIPAPYLDNGNPATGIPGGYPNMPFAGVPGGYHPGNPAAGIPGPYPFFFT
ncbi:MAG: hypothetical protein GX934_13795 [Burkholderiales bacterium]|nr:hypothetical protein [Burkholderiales bacterium]